MLELILLLVVLLPFLWLASEFQEHRWLRILAGCAAIAMSFLVAYAVGALSEMEYNTYYGNASKALIDSTIEHLEAGETEQVLSSLKQLRMEFQPNYETRANYEGLIQQFQERLEQKADGNEGSDHVLQEGQ